MLVSAVDMDAIPSYVNLLAFFGVANMDAILEAYVDIIFSRRLFSIAGFIIDFEFCGIFHIIF